MSDVRVSPRPRRVERVTPSPRELLGHQVDRRLVAGLVVALLSGVVFFWTAGFDAGHPDIFYLADAFLHGRTWLDRPFGLWDFIPIDGRYYLPYAPFPSILFMPLMLVVSPEWAQAHEPLINATLAAIDVALVWMLAGRIGVERTIDRLWLALLLGFSTATWWVTVRGGVWHTGHLIAVAFTLMCLVESFGRRRPLLLGLLAGAAFLTRAPLAFAVPFYALVVALDFSPWTIEGRVAIARRWATLGLGVLPSIAFYFWYNQVRFGSPLESGYELAVLPDFLSNLRAQGLFSLAHWNQNWDYFMLHQPKWLFPDWPFLKPDGLGMSILITSPALLVGLFADWRTRIAWGLAAAFVLVMLPNLLYYGGGWYQYGFRYALDAIPFAVALCAMALARLRPGLLGGLAVWALLAVGLVVNAAGTYWAYH